MVINVPNLRCQTLFHLDRMKDLDRTESLFLLQNKETVEAATFELYSSGIPRGCDECASSLRTVLKSHSVLEEVQMASEGCLCGAYFSGTPSHHTQPVTAETEADVLKIITLLCTSGAARLHLG